MTAIGRHLGSRRQLLVYSFLSLVLMVIYLTLTQWQAIRTTAKSTPSDQQDRNQQQQKQQSPPQPSKAQPQVVATDRYLPTTALIFRSKQYWQQAWKHLYPYVRREYSSEHISALPCPHQRLSPATRRTMNRKRYLLSAVLKNAVNVFPYWRLAVLHLHHCISTQHNATLTVSIFSGNNTDGTDHELTLLSRQLDQRRVDHRIITDGVIPPNIRSDSRIARLAWLRNQALFIPPRRRTVYPNNKPAVDGHSFYSNKTSVEGSAVFSSKPTIDGIIFVNDVLWTAGDVYRLLLTYWQPRGHHPSLLMGGDDEQSRSTARSTAPDTDTGGAADTAAVTAAATATTIASSITQSSPPPIATPLPPRQHTQTADAVCGLDFMYTFYDTWVSRSLDHSPLGGHFPFIQNKSDPAFPPAVRGEVFPVLSCWNGLSVVNPIPFFYRGQSEQEQEQQQQMQQQQQQQKQQPQSQRLHQQQPPPQHPPPPHHNHNRTAPPIRFRHISKQGECSQTSECLFFAVDFIEAGYPIFLLDPSVRVYYEIWHLAYGNVIGRGLEFLLWVFMENGLWISLMDYYHGRDYYGWIGYYGRMDRDETAATSNLRTAIAASSPSTNHTSLVHPTPLPPYSIRYPNNTPHFHHQPPGTATCVVLPLWIPENLVWRRVLMGVLVVLVMAVGGVLYRVRRGGSVGCCWCGGSYCLSRKAPCICCSFCI